MADLDKYFITSHNGHAIEAFTIVQAHGYQEVYSCRVCFTLTVEPVLHAEWHEEVLNGSQS